ncbi:hypothetical protein [Shewanella donghaensis]|uniref:hypothetical protein n=1 Tax=Shewanella donghaensis TaxID=238836 RepID=UPI0011837C2D|nr:hypothetical protein [Shewanella donghaensis]
MKYISQSLFIIVMISISLNSYAMDQKFAIDKDLLLLNFDLKTDVDDVHTIAAFDLLLQSKEYENLNYYAISGTYGIQAGAYVPANNLFDMVFKQNWTDAHNDRQNSIYRSIKKINKTLSTGGKVWIVEAGQSDFTQEILVALGEFNISFYKDQIILVQHADWNEQETSVDALNYVKQNTTYIRIADGNKEGNGTPGFNNQSYLSKNLEDTKLLSSKVWKQANEICTKYNGINGRYDNKAISAGGTDFSDLVEVTYILDIKDTPTVAAFFTKYNKTISEK